MVYGKIIGINIELPNTGNLSICSWLPGKRESWSSGWWGMCMPSHGTSQWQSFFRKCRRQWIVSSPCCHYRVRWWRQSFLQSYRSVDQSPYSSTRAHSMIPTMLMLLGTDWHAGQSCLSSQLSTILTSRVVCFSIFCISFFGFPSLHLGTSCFSFFNT